MVEIRNLLGQSIAIVLKDANGFPFNYTIPAAESVVHGRNLIGDLTWSLARQGHLRIIPA